MTDSLTRCFFEAIQNEEDLPDLGKASSVCEKFVKAVGVYLQASGSFDKQLFILKETMVKTIDMRSLKPFLTGRAEYLWLEESRQTEIVCRVQSLVKDL